MGYTTDFHGSVTISPPLSEKEVNYLNSFSDSRRMNRKNGPYFIGTGDFGQNDDDDVIDHNQPPPGQPGLWCQWVVNEAGTEIEWDGNEKFYEGAAWMGYIIDHFIGDKPQAKEAEPKAFKFLQGHTVNGDIYAQGEDPSDMWMMEVRDNIVEVKTGEVSYE